MKLTPIYIITFIAGLASLLAPVFFLTGNDVTTSDYTLAVMGFLLFFALCGVAAFCHLISAEDKLLTNGFGL